MQSFRIATYGKFIQISSLLILINLCLTIKLFAQVWFPNQSDEKYINPIIYADYSDPDVIRVDDDFFMVASSFNCMPGIPILHSKDLVNWEIINHVYDSLPLERYNRPVHGEGSWAPSIRYHNNKYYVYFCTPHDGLFMATTNNPKEDWELHLIEQVENWEDPCPFWDDDGQAYLLRSKLCGGELYLHKMSEDGKTILDNGILIFKSNDQPIIEGPKFYKKNNKYYILAPAGGVPTGWQTALQAENIYGPYKSKIVLHQGNTMINGPHQGGLVELKSGEWWFVHFQSKDFHGRIVHLQPVEWIDEWPIMGYDIDSNGIGEPVTEYQKPNVGQTYPVKVPQTSDEFESKSLGLQWQWQANPKSSWYSLEASKKLRLYAVKNHTQNGNFWFVPNLLLQKFPMPSFSATTKINFYPQLEGEKCGLVIMGTEWSYLSLINEKGSVKIKLYEGNYNQCEDLTKLIEETSLKISGTVYFKVSVDVNGKCVFSYSLDNVSYSKIGKRFQAKPGKWIGAKVGLFCINPNIQESTGYVDFDWFRIGTMPLVSASKDKMEFLGHILHQNACVNRQENNFNSIKHK